MTRLSSSYDIIIAGAGPAGSALAIDLAQSGFRVLLMDAAVFPRDKVCGDYVSPKGLKRLDELGCGTSIPPIGSVPIRGARLHLGTELLWAGRLPSVTGQPSHGQALPRIQLDQTLFQRALAVGASSLERCTVTNFEIGRCGVDVSAVVGRSPFRASAPLLVGADGATSTVAKVAGLGMNDPRHVAASLRAYAHGLTLQESMIFLDERFFPGYAWAFPVRNGLCNVGVGLFKAPIVRDRLSLRAFWKCFKQRLVDHVAPCGSEIGFESEKGWPIRCYGGATRNYFPRGLLIGEAGCFVDPLNGEGIAPALDSAKIAAVTIRRAFGAGDFTPSMLSSYERDWRQHFDPDLGLSDLVTTVIRNRDFLAVWIETLRSQCSIARHDAAYAKVMSGIISGAIPFRQALSSEIVLRSFLGTWLDPGCLIGIGLSFVRSYASDLLRRPSNVFDTPSDRNRWSLDWMQEVLRKQARVVQRMAASRTV